MRCGGIAEGAESRDQIKVSTEHVNACERSVL
jgi:hypothetical protein